MSTKSEPKAISADAVLAAVAAGAKSPTAVAKHLGFKSGSSSIIKRIAAAVPDIKARLKVNQAKHDAEKMIASPAAYPMPEHLPYRQSSGYGQVFAILFAHREKGISKHDLIAKNQAWSKKPLKNCQFDVHVVTSPREDGSSHRSAAKASGSYWVERRNDFLKLHLVGEGKK